MTFFSNPISLLSIIQLLISLIYIFLLHSYLWTWALYPTNEDITFGDRIILSIGLSFILPPLLFYFLHLYINIPLNDITIYLVISTSNILALLIYALKRKNKNNNGR